MLPSRRLPEADIDTRDMPEQRDWSDAKRGVFYRPIKQQLTLRLDADIIAWFKSRLPDANGYQTRINDALRAYVEQQRQFDAAREVLEELAAVLRELAKRDVVRR